MSLHYLTVDYGVFSVSLWIWPFRAPLGALQGSYRATPCIVHTFDRVLRTAVRSGTLALQKFPWVKCVRGQSRCIMTAPSRTRPGQTQPLWCFEARYHVSCGCSAPVEVRGVVPCFSQSQARQERAGQGSSNSSTVAAAAACEGSGSGSARSP